MVNLQLLNYKILTKKEKDNLEDLKFEAYNALELLDSVTSSEVLKNYVDVNDSLYKAKFAIKDLMGKIDYSIDHSEIDE
jgi:hypothetical protein